MGEVLLEFTPQGAYVKVCAFDTATGVEVSIVGDAKASKETLKDLAVQKLHYVLRKQAQ